MLETTAAEQGQHRIHTATNLTANFQTTKKDPTKYIYVHQ